MINTADIVKAFINSHHGWAVADQFKDTFFSPTEETFSQQNLNALNYIEETIADIIDSEILSEDAIDELKYYHDKLSEYLPK